MLEPSLGSRFRLRSDPHPRTLGRSASPLAYVAVCCLLAVVPPAALGFPSHTDVSEANGQNVTVCTNVWKQLGMVFVGHTYESFDGYVSVIAQNLTHTIAVKCSSPHFCVPAMPSIDPPVGASPYPLETDCMDSHSGPTCPWSCSVMNVSEALSQDGVQLPSGGDGIPSAMISQAYGLYLRQAEQVSPAGDLYSTARCSLRTPEVPPVEKHVHLEVPLNMGIGLQTAMTVLEGSYQNLELNYRNWLSVFGDEEESNWRNLGVQWYTTDLASTPIVTMYSSAQWPLTKVKSWDGTHDWDQYDRQPYCTGCGVVSRLTELVRANPVYKLTNGTCPYPNSTVLRSGSTFRSMVPKKGPLSNPLETSGSDLAPSSPVYGLCKDRHGQNNCISPLQFPYHHPGITAAAFDASRGADLSFADPPFPDAVATQNVSGLVDLRVVMQSPRSSEIAVRYDYCGPNSTVSVVKRSTVSLDVGCTGSCLRYATLGTPAVSVSPASVKYVQCDVSAFLNLSAALSLPGESVVDITSTECAVINSTLHVRVVSQPPLEWCAVTPNCNDGTGPKLCLRSSYLGSSNLTQLGILPNPAVQRCLDSGSIPGGDAEYCGPRPASPLYCRQSSLLISMDGPQVLSPYGDVVLNAAMVANLSTPACLSFGCLTSLQLPYRKVCLGTDLLVVLGKTSGLARRRRDVESAGQKVFSSAEQVFSTLSGQILEGQESLGILGQQGVQQLADSSIDLSQLLQARLNKIFFDMSTEELNSGSAEAIRQLSYQVKHQTAVNIELESRVSLLTLAVLHLSALDPQAAPYASILASEGQFQSIRSVSRYLSPYTGPSCRPFMVDPEGACYPIQSYGSGIPRVSPVRVPCNESCPTYPVRGMMQTPTGRWVPLQASPLSDPLVDLSTIAQAFVGISQRIGGDYEGLLKTLDSFETRSNSDQNAFSASAQAFVTALVTELQILQQESESSGSSFGSAFSAVGGAVAAVAHAVGEAVDDAASPFSSLFSFGMHGVLVIALLILVCVGAYFLMKKFGTPRSQRVKMIAVPGSEDYLFQAHPRNP